MMLTSNAYDREAARNPDCGITAHLIKPVRQSELHGAILRVLEQGAQPSTATPLSDRVARSEPSRKLRILLAEDNPVNQQLALRVLQKEGHSVEAVGNGREALAALAAVDFDLVLMDVQMPEMDGVQATAAIRQQEQGTGEHLPIVALTAHAMPGDRERCRAAGMDGYLAKPFRCEELRQVLAGTLSSAPSSAVGGESCTTPSPVFDLAVALRHSAGDHELLRQLSEVFLRETPGMLKEIKQTLDEKNAAGLRRAAHKLKGSASVFCAPAVVEAALDLENMGRQSDLNQAALAYAKLTDAMMRLKPALSDLGREQLQ
jgi:CheY-like chemotaxis protein/HPt (histidine-containing phosphotransfer) domain-containing protein